MKRITVFCGSNIGTDPQFEKSAYDLGKELAKRNIGVVFGGGKIGMMGAVAKGALEHQGEVIGVIPKFLCKKEIAHEAVTEMKVVKTMHERKAIMNELCDGVITLPGGFGTLEEIFEMLTWAQLGLHNKPIGILNIHGYYDDLIALIQTLVTKGFLTPEHQSILLTDTDIDGLLHKMNTYQAPQSPKWLSLDEI